MNIVLVSADDELDGDCVKLRGRRAHHLRTVLKVAPGRRLRLGRQRGPTGIGEVIENEQDSVLVRVRWRAEVVRPPPVRLVLALPRPKVLHRVLRDAAAIGVHSIELINAWRVERSFFQSRRLEQPALIESLALGCEQGGHTWLPDCRVHRLFNDYLGSLSSAGLETTGQRLLADPSAKHWLVTAAARERYGPKMIAIGPEGGWIARELDALVDHGFAPVRLSAAVLRTEAAVNIALSQLEVASKL